MTADLGAALTTEMLRAQTAVSNAADERAALWVAAVDGGVTGAAIAAACGVSLNTVWRELRRIRSAN